MTNAFFVFKLLGILIFLSIAFGLVIAPKCKP
jgi:hypothetical protein